jgi:hypothetical protein
MFKNLMALTIITITVLSLSCTNNAPIGTITATTKRNQFGGEVTITGKGFPAGHTIRFRYRGIPARSDEFTPGIFTNADAQGNFKVTDFSVRCNTHDHESDFTNVMIVAIDSQSSATENPVTTVSPSIWVCL